MTLPFISPALEASLRRALAIAEAHGHGSAGPDHLLAALTEDPDARPALEACAVDVPALRAALEAVLATLPSTPVPAGAAETSLDPVCRAVVQRAVTHVEASGRATVTGANLLAALFNKERTAGTALLAEQGMTRFDLVNFIAHGQAKRRDQPG